MAVSDEGKSATCSNNSRRQYFGILSPHLYTRRLEIVFFSDRFLSSSRSTPGQSNPSVYHALTIVYYHGHEEAFAADSLLERREE